MQELIKKWKKIGVDDFCVNKKGDALFQGGEVFEDYHGEQEYGQNQVFNLFNRVRIRNNACTPLNHSNHVVPFDRLDLRANSTKRTSRGTRRTLPMRRLVHHGAGGVLHDRGIFLETLHINSKPPAPPLCVLTCPRRQLRGGAGRLWGRRRQRCAGRSHQVGRQASLIHFFFNLQTSISRPDCLIVFPRCNENSTFEEMWPHMTHLEHNVDSTGAR